MHAAICSDSILIEEFVEGENYRFTICKGKILSVLHRLPAFVIGDGKSKLKDLIINENSKRKKMLLKVPEIWDHPLLMPIRPKLSYIKQQGLSLNDVVEKEKQIFCVKETNYSTGGAYIDVTSKVHPEVALAAIKAASVIGIHLAGVDLICNDITLPLSKSGAKINEVNTTPGIISHYEVINQEAVHKVAIPILKELFSLTD